MKSITPQERHVLELIGQGYSTRKIALILNISFHTVQSHRRSLMKKFDALNAVDLVLKAVKSYDFNNLNNDPLQ